MNFTIKKKIFVLIILIFLFGLSFRYIQSPVNKTANSTNVTVNKLPQKPNCNQDLRINELDKYVRDNKTAIDIIKTNCLWVMQVDRFDITGDSNPELIINASGAGCASCHGRLVYILDGEKVIFEKQGDDMQISKSTLPINGFQIKEPLRRHDEAISSPTEGLISTYIYSPKKDRGAEQLVDANYKRTSSLNIANDDYFYLYDVRSERY